MKEKKGTTPVYVVTADAQTHVASLHALALRIYAKRDDRGTQEVDRE